MALFSFGKKDKNPPEVSAPVAKTQPTPPKIQNPPQTGSFPTVKPPQPTGLMPASPPPSGTATTQPMPMPRTGSTGLKPTKPGVPSRSTQRIVLPTTPGSRVTTTKPLSLGAASPATGRINLPMGMILRCLPPEVLAEEISKFEANGSVATEIGLPMNMILGQLPSGKVEIPFQDLLPHFPPGFLQPPDALANYLTAPINLPLMDVVMRIPPDLLALRPDQKDVDSSVINMADPFTEEILREQAEASRRQNQANIIEESQAPQEEFVPRAGITPPVAPPRRPVAEPIIPSRANAVTAMATPPPVPAAAIKPPTPPASGIPQPAAPTVRNSGQIPLVRATTSLPTRGQVTTQIDVPPGPGGAAPVPPVPRHTGPIPAPPPPRHTTSLPVTRRTASVPILTAENAPTPGPAPQSLPAAEVKAPPVDDNLAKLAALAMEQLGDSTESGATAIAKPVSVPVPAPAAEPIVETSAPASVPAPVAPVTPPPMPMPSAPASIRPALPRPEAVPMPKSITAATSSLSKLVPPPAPPPITTGLPEVPANVAFNLNTCTADDLVRNIPDCSKDLAEAIVEHRGRIGSFKRLEDLLDVPGITKAAYKNLTGEEPPTGRIPLSLNELLGFPTDQTISLKDVTERICCWPDVTGCVLSQSTGLSLVGSVPPGVDKAAVVAFAPRMFEAINKSFSEVAEGQDTDALVLPTSPTSFHMFRNKDLYLIIMNRLPQMPERHVKVARFVLSALSIRKD